MSEDQEQKTEQPTDKRLKDLKKQGNVVYSKDAVAACVFVCFVLYVWFRGAAVAALVRDDMHMMLRDLPWLMPHQVITRSAALFVSVVGPVVGLVFAAAIVGTIAQVGLPVELTPLREGRAGLQPLKKLQRLFSADALRQLAAQSVKLAVIGGLFYWSFGSDMRRLAGLAALPLDGGLASALSVMQQVLRVAVLTFVILGSFDYARARRKLMNESRMTKEEVKREAKDEQGSPQLKSRRRQLQRQLAKQQVEAEVRKADVVIVNPTHYAVALRYQSSKMRAPKVVAKGVDHMAERIKAIARERGVVIVENVALARALHAQVRVGRDVPIDLYRAVAEVLAFVYRTRRGHRR